MLTRHSSMLQQLAVTELSDQTNLDIINETSVIIGSLASDGPLTLRPLVLAQVPNRLLALVHSLSQTPLSKSQQIKVLPSVLRALRNILVSAADAVWGHVWGVGAERKVVGTGLVGEDIGEVVGKGKGVSMGGHEWRIEAVSAMRSIFEVNTNSLHSTRSVADTSEPQSDDFVVGFEDTRSSSDPSGDLSVALKTHCAPEPPRSPRSLGSACGSARRRASGTIQGRHGRPRRLDALQINDHTNFRSSVHSATSHRHHRQSRQRIEESHS